MCADGTLFSAASEFGDSRCFFMDKSRIFVDTRKRLLYYIYNYLSGLRHEISRYLPELLNWDN